MTKPGGKAAWEAQDPSGPGGSRAVTSTPVTWPGRAGCEVGASYPPGVLSAWHGRGGRGPGGPRVLFWSLLD